MKVVVISGSPQKTGKTPVLMKFITEYMKDLAHDVERSLEVKFINLSDGDVDYYRGPKENYSDSTKMAAQNIMEADVWFVGTPIYNSFFSSALKICLSILIIKRRKVK